MESTGRRCWQAALLAVLFVSVGCAQDITNPEGISKTKPAASVVDGAGQIGYGFVEDFNSGVLDEAQWEIDPGSGGSTRLADGGIYLLNGARLKTVLDYPPALLGGVRITVRYRTSSYCAADFGLMTRSDGTNGMWWEVYGYNMNWLGWDPDNPQDIVTGSDEELEHIDTGISVEDYGQEWTFRSWDPRSGAESAFSGNMVYSSGSNHIAFYTKTGGCGEELFLDDIRIETWITAKTPDQIVAAIHTMVSDADAAAVLAERVRSIVAAPTPTAKAGKVDAFKKYVNAQRGKKIQANVADQLLALVNKL